MRNILPRAAACLTICVLACCCRAVDPQPKSQPATAGANQEPVASPWSEPSEEGLQTRAVLVTKHPKPGKPIFVRMEVRHKDGKRWAQNTIADSYSAQVRVWDRGGKAVDSESVNLSFSTALRVGTGESIGVFLAGRKSSALEPGAYSVTIEPRTTPEQIKKGMVQLPLAGRLRFTIPAAQGPAPADAPLRPDYEQSAELMSYLTDTGWGYHQLLIEQGKSIVPGLVGLVEKGDARFHGDVHLLVWQYAAFVIGSIGDKRAVPFLVKRLDGPGAMNFYFVSSLGQLGVKQAVPRLLDELRTMGKKDWEVMTQAYGTRADYLVKALEQITGQKFPKDQHDRHTGRDATLKAVDAWWEAKGKKQYPSPTSGPATHPTFDFANGGKLQSGPWECEFGTDTNQRYGFLRFNAKELDAKNVNDSYKTPWGRLYWHGTPKSLRDHKWMPYPAKEEPKGKELADPGA